MVSRPGVIRQKHPYAGTFARSLTSDLACEYNSLTGINGSIYKYY